MKQILCGLALCLATFTSCIKDEPLNAECDIVSVQSEWLEAHKSLFRGEPVVKNNSVSFTIHNGVDRTALNPTFVLTNGAHIMADVDGQKVEANGITRDFSMPQNYTVFSQDGNWNKTYTVSFSPVKPINLLSFENFKLDPSGRYYEWFEIDKSDETTPQRDYWASGNGGYALTGMGKSPQDYPTAPTNNGVDGFAVKLTTCDAGDYGKRVNLPIAAGNIFVGSFTSTQAMIFPRKATRFGLPLVTERPIALRGSYKYKAGPVMTDKNKTPQPALHDTADIYAVVYEIATKSEIEADPKKNKFVPLNGDDVLTSDRIVLMARIDKPEEFTGELADLETAPWVTFNEPFHTVNGKAFSEERLKDNGYAIAIVATSSRQGAYFIGAIGSTLYIDELRVVWEGEE
mgnify:FL=1